MLHLRGCYLKEMPEVAAHDEVGHQSELRRGEEQRSLRPLRPLAREPGLYLLGPYRRVGCICWADLRRWGLITPPEVANTGTRFLTGGPGAARGGVASKNGCVHARTGWVQFTIPILSFVK